MSRLLKAGELERSVHAFASSAARAVPLAPTRSAAELALAEAEAEIARLQAQLVQTQNDAERDIAAAYKGGVADGRNAADDDSARRVDRLGSSLHAARADWDARLDTIDALAVHLARAALAKLFKESSDLGDLVARAIALKAETIRAQSIVAIVVSEHDFADQPALELLKARTSIAGGALVVDSALAAGTCRFDLKLGHIDLGIDTLADELDVALAGLVEPGQRA